MTAPATLFEKIWSAHVVKPLSEDRAIVHIDRHVLQETTCLPAFAGLQQMNQPVRNVDLTYGVIDHSVSSSPGRTADSFPPSRYRIVGMRDRCREFGVELFDIDDPRQGIVHVIAPELGIALPGTTLVCADSHTATSGGLGAWAWGIGTTEVRHVLASQCLVQRKPATMRVSFEGMLQPGVFAKDLILHLIGRYGVAAGTGHVVEYAGSAIRAMPIEGRLTICNMSVEFGARAGLIGADDTTFDYIAGRPFAPAGAAWDAALAAWRDAHSDAAARFDREITIDCNAVTPQITWGTSPQDVSGVDECVPAPDGIADPVRRRALERTLDYIDLQPGQHLEGIPIDVAFIGSCTNGRLSDLETAADILRGRHVAPGVRGLVVPGSSSVKRAAEAIGLDRIFRDAGFEWRESSCSMCVAANGDTIDPGQRCITTSNRNFEDRQGAGARTHLASPATVAASAIRGSIAEARKL